MSPSTPTIPPAEALRLHSLITPTEQGIASRVLAKTAGGNLTLFAFDAGQGLTEHTSPFDAFVMVLDGVLTLAIGGTVVRATPGTIVRMPAGVSHAVEAPEAPGCCSSCCVTEQRGACSGRPRHRAVEAAPPPAAALGLTVLQSNLARADEVIW